MSYNKANVKNSVVERLQQIRSFLQSINQCTLCSEPLTLIHEINADENQVLETAHCSKCKLDMRKKEHGLH